MSESSQSTAIKRPREDDTEDVRTTQAKKARDDATILVRDEEFWYEDGTIILVARNVEFRVYKGVLADHSSVFADMFSLPQPQSSSVDAQSLALDCPIVHLEESPEDLRHIFRAILPKKHTSLRLLSTEPPKITFNMISAYARLGHKYQLDNLLAQALDFLRHHFPSNLDRWNEIGNYVPQSWTYVNAIGVVNLSRLTTCDSILPVAMLVCCMLEGKDLLQGFKREDGTREKLSEHDAALCITALSSLSQECARIMLKAFAPYVAPGCCSPEQCQRKVHAFLCSYEDEPMIVANRHPFRPWCYYHDGWLDSDVAVICPHCLRLLELRLEKEQRELWCRLPEVLGITVAGWPGRGNAETDAGQTA